MPPKSPKTFLIQLFIIVSLVLFTFAAAAIAQTPDEISAATKKVSELFDQQRFGEAVPYLQTIVKAQPGDPKVRFLLGFALLAKSKTVDEPDMGKLLAAQALAEFKKAKELGFEDEMNDKLIALLSTDAKTGGNTTESGLSKNPEANKMMGQAESFFAKSDYDKAFEFYQKALALDPTIYEAALFSGDIFLAKNDFKNAEVWYQKAIVINPERETAYRYSATPLMKQKKYAEARDRYIEAYITEPYGGMAIKGLLQWAQATETRLAHPKFDIPEFTIGADGKAKSTINVNPLAMEGSMAWIGYTSTRSEWHEKKFAKTFPNDKQYRHTLQEEVEALRSVIELAKEMKGKGKNEGIEKLTKLDQEGLLEAYVLLAIPDDGIAQDHPAYLRQNRDKLRQYVAKYVVTGGGK
jgi:tetratricopeptide (TPR) repeat protein